jgi:hypothetical protein
MPQPHSFDPPKPPVSPRRCPMCGLPMFLALVEPCSEVDREERTFECTQCAYGETVTVKFP